MKKKLLVLLASICLVIILVACAAPAPTPAPSPAPPAPEEIPPAEPVTLKLATFFGAPSMQVKALDDFAADVERHTNGLVKIDIFPGGALLATAELKEGVVAGVCDMAYLCQYQPSGIHPATEILGLPLGAPTGWVMSKVSEDWYREFLPEAEYEGTVVLWISNVTPEVLMTRGTPVYKLEDLEGLKIRAIGPGAEVIEALGGTAIGVPTPAIYDGIQKGEFDGALIATEALSAWKLAEVMDYVTNCWQLGKGCPKGLLMNAAAYNNLHPDVKPIFERLVGVYRERQILGWNVQDFYGVQKALDNGVTFIELSDTEVGRWQDACDSVIEAYVARTVAAGFSETEVRSWIEYIQERNVYWTAKQVEYGIISAVGPPEVRPENWIP